MKDIDAGCVRWVHWQKHYQKDEVVRLGDDVMFTFFKKNEIHSMQGWTATTRHGVTRKKAQKRLQDTENV